MFGQRFALAALVALLFVPAASAQEYRGRFELFGGYYNPDGDLGEEDFSVGLRAGWDVNDKFGMDFSGEFFDTDLSAGNTVGSTTVYDLDLRSWDFSFIWYPTGGGFYILGGPGWSTLDINVRYDDGVTRRSVSLDETVISVHAGIGYLWQSEGSFYIRPDARLRWMDQDFEDDDLDTDFDYDAVDFGVYIGFGWAFG